MTLGTFGSLFRGWHRLPASLAKQSARLSLAPGTRGAGTNRKLLENQLGK
jgi:hypothetical protein